MSLCTLVVMLATGAGFAGCLGHTSTVTLDAETATLGFGVVSLRLEAGDGEVVDFCVVLNESACGFPGGEVVGCELEFPQSSVTIFCGDPILSQWPDTWTLTSASWNAPASGRLLVEPASN